MAAGDVYRVNANTGVTVSGATTRETYVRCVGGGVTLTIDGVTIADAAGMSASPNFAPIRFDGTGNKLILVNTSHLTGGFGSAGIQIADNGAVDISGGGTVYAQGGT
jgi:hypothetical protein